MIKNEQRTPELISVKVDIPAGWSVLSEYDRQQTVDSVRDYVNRLFQSLDIPTELVLEIDEVDDLASQTVRINVSDQVVRVSIEGLCAPTFDERSWSGVDEIVVNVSRALFSARERLVTDRVVARICSTWPSGAVTSDSRRRRWLLSQAIRYGFRVGRISESIEREGFRARDQREVQRLFERVIDPVGPGRISISLSQPLHDRYTRASGLKLKSGPDEQSLEDMLDMMADGLFNELGIRFSLDAIELNRDIAPNWFQLQINDMPLPLTKGLAPREFLVNALPEALVALGITGLAKTNPASGKDSAVVQGGQNELTQCEQAGFTIWGPMGYIILHASSAIRMLAGAFMTSDILRFLLLQVSFIAPQLVQFVLEKLQVADITKTLRSLLDEHISIRDLRFILEILAKDIETLTVDISKYIVYNLTDVLFIPSRQGGQVLLDPDALAAVIRINLKRYISYTLSRGSNELNAYILDPQVESWLTQSQDPSETKEAETFLAGLRDVYDDDRQVTERPVLLTDHHARSRLCQLVKLEFPGLSVVSYPELVADINIKPLKRLAFT